MFRGLRLRQADCQVRGREIAGNAGGGDWEARSPGAPPRATEAGKAAAAGTVGAAGMDAAPVLGVGDSDSVGARVGASVGDIVGDTVGDTVGA